MPHGTAQHIPSRHARTLAALTMSLMLGACSGASDLLPSPTFLSEAEPASAGSADAGSELRQATEYWGKQFASKPGDKTAAISYAKNLKALGDKRMALSVLQSASSSNPSDPEVHGELGRLALEFDQLAVASRSLEIADVPDKPDWKVISARGTVLAKQGQHKAAIPFFERALALAPNQASVLNNLAMANAMSGNPQKAEEILRTATGKEGASPKINQNLALVLGLQGKYDESKAQGAVAGSTLQASENADYLKRMVRIEPKPAPTAVAKAPANAGPVAATATAPLPWANKTVALQAAPAAPSAPGKKGPINDAFRPSSVDNTSTAQWQTAVSAAQPNTAGR